MEPENNVITTAFSYTDRFGNAFSNASTIGLIDGYTSDLDVIGEQLNALLAQAGFCRPGTCMLMDSLTEDERRYLQTLLREYRENN